MYGIAGAEIRGELLLVNGVDSKGRGSRPRMRFNGSAGA